MTLEPDMNPYEDPNEHHARAMVHRRTKRTAEIGIALLVILTAVMLIAGACLA